MSPTPEPEADPRIHRAAHDPDFPAQREAALATIRAAIHTIAAAQGFTAKGQAWVLDGPQGRASLHIQRSRYGWEAAVNLGFQPAKGEPTEPWAKDGLLPLQAFCTDGEDAALRYLDVINHPASLDAVLQILATRALPWLIAQLDRRTPMAT